MVPAELLYALHPGDDAVPLVPEIKMIQPHAEGDGLHPDISGRLRPPEKRIAHRGSFGRVDPAFAQPVIIRQEAVRRRGGVRLRRFGANGEYHAENRQDGI